LPKTTLLQLLKRHRGALDGRTEEGRTRRKAKLPRTRPRDPRGRKLDLNQSQQVLQLRAEGLTFLEIGKRLDVTKQAAQMLYRAATEDQPPDPST
jgi:hypothetical protein